MWIYDSIIQIVYPIVMDDLTDFLYNPQIVTDNFCRKTIYLELTRIL